MDRKSLAGNHASARVMIDAAFQRYVEGKQKSIDIGFKCRRIQRKPEAPEDKGPSNENNADSIGDLLMSHPLVDLDIEILNSTELEKEFYWENKTESMTKVYAAEAPSPYPDGVNDYTFANNTLTITCNKSIQIDSANGKYSHYVFCSKSSAKTFNDYYLAIKQAHAEFKHDVIHGIYKFYSFLFVGPSGSGKELAGLFLKQILAVPEANFSQFNTAGMSDYLVQGELFGHKKGSFVDAHEDRKGKLEQVGAGGVFVMDEIAAGAKEMQTRSQASLLRAIPNGEIMPVGGVLIRRRIFFQASTNEAESISEIPSGIERGVFRKDLPPRFPNQFEFSSLRERCEEIVPSFVWMIHKKLSGITKINKTLELSFERKALDLLIQSSYHGNFRDLEMVATYVAPRLKNVSDVITAELVANALRLTMDKSALTKDDTKKINVKIILTVTGFEQLENPVAFETESPETKNAGSQGGNENPWGDWTVKEIKSLQLPESEGIEKGRNFPQLNPPENARIELCARLIHCARSFRERVDIKKSFYNQELNVDQEIKDSLDFIKTKVLPQESDLEELIMQIKKGSNSLRHQDNHKDFLQPRLYKHVLLLLLGHDHQDGTRKIRSDRMPSVFSGAINDDFQRGIKKHLNTKERGQQNLEDKVLNLKLIFFLLTGLDVTTDEEITSVLQA